MPSHDDKPLTPQQARAKLQEGLMNYLAGKGPEAIVFRLKRARKGSETYPLKLTERQRQTLLKFTQLGRTLKKKIAQAGEGTQVVGVTWNEMHKLNDATGEALVYAPRADADRLLAVQAKLDKLFDAEEAEVLGFGPSKRRQRQPRKSNVLYQFKITLLGIKPPIWRRIQVRDCTLSDLHRHIQAAFGWCDYHLHQFEIDGVHYSEPSPDGDDFGLVFDDDRRFVLSNLLPSSGQRTRWLYEYDFGDGWQHEVLFEGCPPVDPKAKYPLCLEGQRACPPEDCGGPWGYSEYLDAIADPAHEEHQEMLEWRGPFDPEKFDANFATKAMRQRIP